MKVSSVLTGSFLVVLASAALVVVGAMIDSYRTQKDATSAVQIALDSYLAGQPRTNLYFLSVDLSESETFNFDQFSFDIKTGYELKSGDRWMNAYDVDILTANGRTYVASPLGGTTHWPDGHEEFSWDIICCESRN